MTYGCKNFEIADSGVLEQLSEVRLDMVADDIETYEFKRHLSYLLGNNSKAFGRYKLKVDFEKNSSTIAIQKDSDNLRENIEFKVFFKLYEVGTDKLLYSGKFRQINSYNALFSPYSTNLEIGQTNINLYKACAEELRRKLIIFLKTKK
ncbi:MAG: hypothetical protein SFT93_01525 [Rickettsiaceae bacterium]|nr:hypothetical protein [Rickettsiaceae bacterium]